MRAPSPKQREVLEKSHAIRGSELTGYTSKFDKIDGLKTLENGNAEP